MKQVYTVEMTVRNDEFAESIMLLEHGEETTCPHSHNDAFCGDWCPMFEFTDNDKFRGEPWAKVTLHCCGRVIPVGVVE